ncbi:AtpZ/AtpI family protein [Poseidonocella sedimentorum]|uniref:ATP synthase protein I n=1 Tax=Poseidonocella sedimentorum TaxID=871652 RepID=A0A1I6DQH2_9RHOB|nr:AtpZ/AtpI family protein [Poseidonocella sedimentorum]SFR07608.1 ATP synthase protein I [Poseidonocella sedimentorum]
MHEPSDDTPKASLAERIEAARAQHAPKPHMEEHYSQAQHAWRMVTELVAGLGIGFGIGYGLDRLLGTTPWLMVLFIFLGFAAGIKVMMRSAKEIQRLQALELGVGETADDDNADDANADEGTKAHGDRDDRTG